MNDSTIASVAGEILSGMNPRVNPTGNHAGTVSEADRVAVRWAVAMAFLVAEEVATQSAVVQAPPSTEVPPHLRADIHPTVSATRTSLDVVATEGGKATVETKRP